MKKVIARVCSLARRALGLIGLEALVSAGTHGLSRQVAALDARLDEAVRGLAAQAAVVDAHVVQLAQALHRLDQDVLWVKGKLAATERPWHELDLRNFERRVYSQNGEDGILEEIFRRVGTTNRFFVEFGVESGAECNCARLALEEGWQG